MKSGGSSRRKIRSNPKKTWVIMKRACAKRARQLRRSRNAAPLCARSALTSEARGSRAESAPAGGASAKTTRARCWRTGARRICGGGASDGPAPAAGTRRSGPAPTGAGCWRGPERATRGTRAKPAGCGCALARWNGVLESALAHRKHTGARTWSFLMRPKRTQAPSIAAGGRYPRRHGVQGAAAAPAPCSHRTQAGSPGGSGGTGARIASHAGAVSRGLRRVRRPARIARRRSRQGCARVAAPANHARSRGLRYGGHSISSSWASMAQGLALGCFSGDVGFFQVERQPRWSTGGQVDQLGGAGAGGALLRTPITVQPAAACRVRALPWHGQAGGSGRGAGGAAARRGRGAAGGRWSGGTVAPKWRQAKHCRNIGRDGADAEPNPGSTWGVCRHGRARRKMERWPAQQCERRRASLAPLATFFVVRGHGDKRPKRAHDAPQPRQRRTPNGPLACATAAP